MRSLRSLFVALTLLAAPAAWSAPAVHGLDPAEVEALVAFAAETDRLWDARRADELAALYADDGNLEMVGTGRGAQGREGVRAYFTESFGRIAPDLRHLTTVERLTRVGDDAVVGDSRVALVRQAADGGRETLREFVTHSVLVREGDGWKLAAVRAHVLSASAPVAASPATSAAAVGAR